MDELTTGLRVEARDEPGGVTRVLLSGEADYAAARHLRARLEEINGEHVVIDMKAVTLCDSSCIATLAFAARRQRQRGKEFTLRNPRPVLLRTLERLGLEDVFQIEAPR
jgi:anti-anti-sigma factor